MAPEIAALADTLADALPEADVDLLPAFAERLPVVVIARLLGLPDAAADDLLAWSHAMVAMYQARRDRAVEEAANAAARAFAAFLRAEIEARRRRPGDDLLSELIAAEEKGDRLDADELVATCVLLLNAGHEATVHAIGNGLATILGQGLDRAALFADPEATERTVEEILRHDPPLHLFTRYALEDVEVFGHRFARGETVGCLLAAANRDPCASPTRPLRPCPATRAASLLRRRHPLLRRRSARPARARRRPAGPLRPPARSRARGAAALRRPLSLPRARGTLREARRPRRADRQSATRNPRETGKAAI